MKKLEVFFDYNCPYCLKGHDSLAELVKASPISEIIWHPCEIAVFKNQSELENDLSLQGMFFAEENNIDIWQYHQRVYNMKFVEKLNTHDINTFANALKDLLDADALREALASGKYSARLKEANRYAFKETGVHVVPTYRADGGCLQDRQEFFGLGETDTGYGGKK